MATQFQSTEFASPLSTSNRILLPLTYRAKTLDRSTLCRLKPGTPVNLERAVTPATRLGGHIVQGHVDARGKFVSSTDLGGSWTVRIAYPSEIARYLVFKGSVAVEGLASQ